jgi:CHAD domain-containing protein
MVHSIGSRLVHAIARQAEKAGYYSMADNLPVNQQIHELRRGFKRMRALLRFFNEIPGVPAGQLQKDIRNFGKLLAPLRESAVNMELFDKEISSNPLIPQMKIRIARDFLADRNRVLLEKGYRDNKLDNTIHAYFQDFDTVISGNANELPLKVHFFREICQSYMNGSICYRRLADNPHPEEWHDLRKKLKRLWYQLDFIRFLHPGYIKLKTDQLNKITDQLGDDHDLHIFSEDLLAWGYGFDDEEQQIMKNQIKNLIELNQFKLQLRLNQFFTAPAHEFDQKLERFFRL